MEYTFPVMLIVLCFCTHISEQSIHIYSKAIASLQTNVEELKKAQEDHWMKITSLNDKMSELEAEGEFERELNKLEKKIAIIFNHLSNEKTQDKALRKSTEHVLQDMEEKVDETENLIEDLKDSVKLSVDDFEAQIKSVNVSAHLTVNVRGVVFYGGVGTACTVGSVQCLVEDTECRDGRCQCVPGLSYNVQDRSCVRSCTAYGDTYQVVDHYIIRGHNSDTVTNITSMEECHEECKNADFTCRSIDFFPRWKKCYLSSDTKIDVPDKAWEYNSAGYHFQRDCAELMN